MIGERQPVDECFSMADFMNTVFPSGFSIRYFNYWHPGRADAVLVFQDPALSGKWRAK
jgi:hypothetical protein